MNSGSPLIRAISLAMITFLLLTACGADQPTEEAGQTTEAGVDGPAEETTDIEENEGAQPEQSTGVTVERGKSVGEIQTEPGPGEVKLWVSNQSFDDDPIHLTVTIGDVTVVEEHFEVEGQHNWIAFDIKGLEPGSHTIVAESDTGATLTVDFTVVADEPRWLVLDYWYYPEDAEGRYFTFDESDQPVGFA